MHGRSRHHCATTNSYKRLVPGMKRRLIWLIHGAIVRRVQDSDVFGESEGKARGVPATGSFGESVSGVCGVIDGRPRCVLNKIEREIRWIRIFTI